MNTLHSHVNAGDVNARSVTKVILTTRVIHASGWDIRERGWGQEHSKTYGKVRAKLFSRRVAAWRCVR